MIKLFSYRPCWPNLTAVRHVASLGIFGVVLLAATPVFAQGDSELERALAHADRGEWFEAERLLREAVTRDGTEQQRFQLARVLAELGRVVEANGLAEEIADDPDGDLLFRDAARTLASELRARIATLVVLSTEPAPPVSLTVDGNDVSLAQARSGVSMDPGVHRLQAHDERGTVLGTRDAVLTAGQRLEVALRSLLIRPPTERTTPPPLAAPTSPVAIDEDGSAVELGWWLAIGGAATLGAIVLIALLVSSDEVDPTAGDVPAVTIGGET